MRKRLIQKVELVFFQDDANGEYGVTHKETLKEGFNAFWGAIGIFHDVWEHNHEYTNKYFMGDNAMNIGGEMAAMGKMWYYQDELGLGDARNLNSQSRYSPGENMRLTTQMEIEETIKYGYTKFGSTLESKVPRQNPVDNGELEYQIEKMWKDIKGYSYQDKYEDEKEYSNQYKKSCSLRKIADLHRWGYRQGEKMVPNTYSNRQMMWEFMEFWKEFCKHNPAEELQTWAKGITFYLYKQGEDVSWKAKVISNDYAIQDMWIKSVHEIYPEEIVY